MTLRAPARWYQTCFGKLWNEKCVYDTSLAFWPYVLLSRLMTSLERPRTYQLRTDMKILLIEDSKFQRIATERTLLKAGYDVIHAGDGGAGLRIARETIPDLILLDIMLPKLSGLDLLRVLKSDALVKHIPVIVFTGLGHVNKTKLLKDGAAAFLSKSEKSLENNSSILIQTVEEVLKATTAQM